MNLKKWLIAAATLLALMCIVLITWVWNLNDEVQDKLQNRRFLPPTEFYTSPLAIGAQDRWTRDELRHELVRRQYRENPPDRPLSAGQFWSLEGAACTASIGHLENVSEPQCLILSPQETPDPEFAQPEMKLQAVIWSAADPAIVAAAARANPLRPAAQVWLEPEVFAQYLGSTPVLQNWTNLGDTPSSCLNAVLAIEDSQFLEHGGVSFLGIGRAAAKNILQGRFAQGGSTITQQMVKNFFLTSERTLKRKVTEIMMSMLLEAHANKDEIFETYLNIIYMGQSGPFEVRGFGAAARHYFNQDLSQLGLSECSLLAAILNSPGNFDPSRKPEAAQRRRARVLERMAELSMISPEDAASAQAAPLPKIQRQTLWETAPYYIQAALFTLTQAGLSSEGLQIFTGLKSSHQEVAQKSVQGQIEKLEKDHPKIKEIAAKGIPLEGLLLSMDLRNNWITAAVGGRSFRKTQYNRILDGHRQIGSLMKPFVFYSALENDPSLNALTTIKDAKFSYKYEGQTWSPVNYGRKYEGEVPMYYALKKSLNAATAQAGITAGLPRLKDVAERAGSTSTLKPLPSLTLGAFELYPTEVLRMYSTLAHLGQKSEPIWVRSARYPQGNTVYTPSIESSEVLDPVVTAQVVGMMKQTTQSGTAAAVKASGFDLPTAGKTGTTSDSRDTWFAGFTPQRLTLAWIGYDQNASHNLTGGSGTVPIWIEFMKKATEHDSKKDFAWPSGVRSLHVQPALETSEIELILKN